MACCNSQYETKMNKTPFQLALDSIYEQNEMNFTTILQNNPEIKEEIDGPWYLIHHLYKNYWKWGIQFYELQGGKINLITQDYVSSLQKVRMFLVGGQTILHILASDVSGREILDEMCLKYPDLNIPDFNGSMPIDIATRKKSISNHIEESKKVSERINTKNILKYDISLSETISNIQFIDIHNQLMSNDISVSNDMIHSSSSSCVTDNDDITYFQFGNELKIDLENQLLHIINNESISDKINSMHRYGTLLLPAMQYVIFRIIKTLLPLEYHSRITHVHSFYIKYNNASQKALASHMDDSTFTINMCLNNTSSGGELVFDNLDITYQHQPLRGLMHRGSIVHHVNELSEGERENIIIWISTD